MNKQKNSEEYLDCTPLVSIVIPVYNAERTLAACLDSVFEQTCKNFEVILIDDGSTDGSPQICQAFARSYPEQIHYVREINGGPATARNAGIEISKGKYIAFVDSDDQVSPMLIETMTQKAEEAGAQMVLCAYYLINDNQEKVITYDLPEGNYTGNDCKRVALSVLTEARGGIPPYSGIRLTLRKVLETTGIRFQSGLVRSEDYHFWAKIHFSIDSVYVLSNTPLYRYIENSQSITHSHVERYWTDVLFMYRDLYDLLPCDINVSEALDMMLVKRSLIALNNAARCETIGQAKKEISSIIKDRTLLNVIASLAETDAKSFKDFRFLMNHRLGFLVALKYFFRAIRCPRQSKNVRS